MLLAEIRDELDVIPEVHEASRTWLSVPSEGEPDELDVWIAAQAEPFFIRP